MLERLWKTEPARVVSTVTAMLTALFAVVAAFGLDLSDAQTNAILGAVAPIVAAIFFMGEIIRGQVYAPETVEQIKDQAQATVDAAYVANPAFDPKPTIDKQAA
jgi:hypothetical protein